MASPDRVSPADDVQQYATFSSDIDIAAVRGEPARFIRVEDAGAGTLAVVLSGSGGATRTLTVTEGWEIAAKIITIKAATDVGRVTVAW